MSTAPTSDFNDLAVQHGPDAVRRQVDAALPPGTYDYKHTDTIKKINNDPENGKNTDPDRREGKSPLAPPVMAPEHLPGLLGDIVQAACADSEAHPVAVALHVLCWFCCAIGRGPYQRVGDAVIHARVYALVVGKSGKARKGTAEHTPREIFRRADQLLRDQHHNHNSLRIHAGGLSSGEGVAYAIRDAQTADDKTGKGGDPGVVDKRLLVVEPEFANVLAQVLRDGNTLSATVRNLFDGRDIEPLTKASPVRASRPHVVLIGHITGFELRAKSTSNDAANGLLNRFMVMHVQRPKLVPLPRSTPEDMLNNLAGRVAEAIDFATGGNPQAHNCLEVSMDAAAEALWSEHYSEVSRDRAGKAGSLTARSEMYGRMLAMVFALLDGRSTIAPTDIRIALAWVAYWHQSITYVFLTTDDDGELSPLCQELLALVRQRPGIKLTEVQDYKDRNKTRAVKDALQTLLGMAPPLIVMRLGEKTGGRRPHCYYPVGA